MPWSGPLATPNDARRIVQRLEGLGFEWVSSGEHVYLPKQPKTPYPGSPDGLIPADPTSNVLEVFTCFAWLAGQTTTIRFETGILLLPLRRPLVAAKQVATLDYLSGGRLTLAVAAGWKREECDACGVPFNRRGRVLDETLGIFKALFEGDGSFDGPTVQFDETWFEPKPVQRPFPIIVAGAPVETVLQRVTKFGAGWNPWGDRAPDVIARGVQELKKRFDAAGRDPDSLEVQTYLFVTRNPSLGPVVERDALLETIEAWSRAGVTKVTMLMGEFGGRRLPSPPTVDGVLMTAEWLADQILPEVSDRGAHR